MNAIALQFDPTPTILLQVLKIDSIKMFLENFEGIGARLSKRNQEIEIVEVISGEPVWRGKLIEPGDKIFKTGAGR